MLENLGAFHIDPLTGLRGLEHGVADVLRPEGIAEVRIGFFGAWVIEALHELNGTMDEGMFVAEAEARDPPVAGVRVVAIGDVDAGPAACFSWDVMVEVSEAVEIVEVPREGFVMAVDLEGLVRFMTAGVAGGFEDGGGAIFKTGKESAGVIDGDRVFFTGLLVDTFFDEGLGHGGNGDDVTIDPAGAVDVVRKEITRYA